MSGIPTRGEGVKKIFDGMKLEVYTSPEKRRCDAELSWEAVEFNRFRNKPDPDHCPFKAIYCVNGTVYMCKRHAQQWVLEHILKQKE